MSLSTRDRIFAVLYDLAMTVGGEVNVRPLLTRVLQRLMFHTSFPVGMVFLDVPPESGGSLEVTLELSVGDADLAAFAGKTFALPARLLMGRAEVIEERGLIDSLPCRKERYGACLRLPIDGRGVILLLSPVLPANDLPLTQIFQPVMGNLSRAILLCRRNEAYAQAILSDRDRAQSGLERFRAALDSSADAAFLVDLQNHRLVDVNRTAERLSGYERNALFALDLTALLPEGARAALSGLLDDFLNGRSRDGGMDTRLLRKDGTSFPVDARLSLYEGKAGERLAIALVRDITERKQAEEALRRLNRALRTLSAGNMTLIHAIDETSLLRDVCRVAVEVGDYPIAWVGLENNGDFHAAIGHCLPGEETTLAVLQAACGKGCCCSQVLQNGEMLILHDIGNGGQALAEAERHGLVSAICLPLKTEEKVYGVLNIYSRDPQAFNSDEVSLLSEMSSDLAFGIATLRARTARQRAEEAARDYLARLHHTLEGAVAAIALTIEKRDPYTAGHQRRTATLAVAIARELGLDEHQVEGVYFGGLIHDIGKIYVPVEILSRPGRITPTEYAIIKSHPEVGFDIMKDIEFPWPVAQMIRQHHERLDGTGYPKGLKDGEILLEARILAVADVVEAIASHRPYRPSLGIEAALAEIEKGRGALFDAAAVDACLRLFRERNFQLEH